MTDTKTPTLDRVAGPADLRSMSDLELRTVADELRAEVVEAVSQTGGHLGSSLGVVELSVAIHAGVRHAARQTGVGCGASVLPA